MQSLRLLLIAVLVAVLFPGCALLRKLMHKPPPAKPAGPKQEQFIGTIVLVNTDGAFVLIDNGSQPSPSKGTLAQSHAPDGSLAQLKVTEIRKRPFVIADIVTGTPHKGDPVSQ